MRCAQIELGHTVCKKAILSTSFGTCLTRRSVAGILQKPNCTACTVPLSRKVTEVSCVNNVRAWETSSDSFSSEHTWPVSAWRGCHFRKFEKFVFRCCSTNPQPICLKYTDSQQIHNAVLFYIPSYWLMLCVCFWSGPWSHGVGNQATECRDRGTGSHSTWDHAHPPGGCGHWEMTPTSLFQHSLRDYKPLQPASLYNALVLGYIHPSHTIYIRYIFNTKPQHKGILWSVF